MEDTIRIEAGLLAEDLYALIQALAPARRAAEAEKVVRDLLQRVLARLRKLLEARPLESMREQLREIEALVREAVKDVAGTRWSAFRARVGPAYENLAARLRAEHIPAKPLRPTNVPRTIFHITSGFVALACIELLFDSTGIKIIASAFALLAWTLEIARRASPTLRTHIMRVFGRTAHPHEHHRVNSATWYATALLIIAFLTSPLAQALAVIVLGLGDPMAGIVGRKYGRIRLLAGRSLEGTLAFAATGTVVGLGVLTAFHPEVGWGLKLAIAFTAGISGALAELFSQRLDDNFTIPISVAAAVTAVTLLAG